MTEQQTPAALTDADLTVMETRERAATPGPWSVDVTDNCMDIADRVPLDDCCIPYAPDVSSWRSGGIVWLAFRCAHQTMTITVRLVDGQIEIHRWQEPRDGAGGGVIVARVASTSDQKGAEHD